MTTEESSGRVLLGTCRICGAATMTDPATDTSQHVDPPATDHPAVPR